MLTPLRPAAAQAIPGEPTIAATVSGRSAFSVGRRHCPLAVFRSFSIVLVGLGLVLGATVGAGAGFPVADSFAPETTWPVNALVIQPDGKIIEGDEGLIWGGAFRRLQASGEVDTSFAPSRVCQSVHAIVLQPDGKILVGGVGDSTWWYPSILRLRADGAWDETFACTIGQDYAEEIVYAIALQADGRVILGGNFTAVNGESRSCLARVDSLGALDPGFSVTADKAVRALFIQPDGMVLIGGEFSQLGGEGHSGLGRAKLDGTLDRSFNVNIHGVVHSIILDANGKILVGGEFDSVNGRPRANLCRLNLDGSVDEAFALEAIGKVSCFAMQKDGMVLLGGAMMQIGEADREYLARLNPDGSLDVTYQPLTDDGRYSEVRALAVQADNKVLVGGDFMEIGDQPRRYIGRLNSAPGSRPTITAQPRKVTASVGMSARFMVTATAPWKYQWRRNGLDLSDGGSIHGANTARLTIDPTRPGDAGEYSVVVSNYYGSVTSSNAALILTTASGGDCVWVQDLGAPLASAPAIGASGSVYVVTENGDVMAFQGVSGTLLWQTNMGVWGGAHPASVGGDGTVYVGCFEGTCALNPSDGSVKWVFRTNGLSPGTANSIAADGTLYFGGTLARYVPPYTTIWDPYLFALSTIDGTLKWASNQGGWGGASAIGPDGTLYDAYHARIRAFNPSTRSVKWDAEIGDVAATSLAFGNGIIFAGTWSGTMFGVRSDGVILWNFPAGCSSGSSPALGANGLLYFGSTNGTFFALDALTGVKKWQFATQGPISSSPAVGADGTVYFGSDDGRLYALDGTTGQVRWEFVTEGAVRSSPAISTNGVVYFTSSDGKLHALRATAAQGLADSPWPMLMQNPAHTAQARKSSGAPVITMHPETQVVALGAKVIFKVTASGALPLSYRWYKDGVALSNSANVTGVTSSTLTILKAQLSDAGRYSVVVSNAEGSARGADAVLTVQFVDTERPRLTIIRPSPNQNVSNLVVVASLNATDNVGVTEVRCQLNGGAWTLASPVDGGTNWTATLRPVMGRNT